MKTFTLTEVAKKCAKKGSKELWVVINGEVFDVSDFVKEVSKQNPFGIKKGII